MADELVYGVDRVLRRNRAELARFDASTATRWGRIELGSRSLDIVCETRWRGWTAALVDQRSGVVECEWVPRLIGRGGRVDSAAGRLSARGTLLRPNRLHVSLPEVKLDVSVEPKGPETVSAGPGGLVTFSGREAFQVRLLGVDLPQVSATWVSPLALLCWVLVEARQPTRDVQMHPGPSF